MRSVLFIAAGSLSFLSANQAIAEETYIAQNVNNISEELRKKCLGAADFEGCVRSFTHKTSQPAQTQRRRTDSLGMPIIVGWHTYENAAENSVWYTNNVKAVKVRGMYGRYIGFEFIRRWYQQGVAGTSPTSFTLSEATTNCYGSGTNYGSGYSNTFGVNCTTTPANTINIPGTAATPAGVRQLKGFAIIDCLERTGRVYRFAGGWRNIDHSGSHLDDPANKYCNKISSLPKTTYSDLAKGKPNDQDKKALRVLSGNSDYDSSQQTQSKPENGSNYVNQANAKYGLGDREGACADYKKAVSLGNQGTAQWLNSADGAWCRNMR